MSVQMQMRYTVDLTKPLFVRKMQTLLGENDSLANAVVLEMYDGKERADLSGYTVVGGFARADGATVPLLGTVEGNVITVELTGACYNVQGWCGITIKLSGAETRTVFKAVGTVEKDAEDAYVDEEIYTSFDALIEKVIQDYLDAHPPGITEETDPTVPEWAKQPEKPTYTKSDVGLSNVANVRQYSANNPPPYPVTSVNGQTGAAEITAEDVGLGSVDNVRQYSADNPPPYPVTSVNGMTGAVVLEVTGGDGGIAVETDPTVPAWAKQADPPTYTKGDVGLGNVDNVRQYSASNPPPYPVTSVNGQTGAVTIEVPESDGDADSLGGVAASVYKDFMTIRSHTVTVNSAFVNSGSITAYSVGGVLKVGGYLQTKKQHAVSTPDTICTIAGVKMSGMAYAAVVDHDGTGKAFNALLLTENNATRVQLEGSASSIASGAWLNFTVVGILE